MIRARIAIRFVPLLALFAGCFGGGTDVTPPSAPTSDPSLTVSTLELAPPPRELVYLEITSAAARELKAHVADMKLERWWLRYTMVPGGCTGFRNKLDLDPGPPTDQDFEYTADGVSYLVLKSQRHLVQGTRIDFGEKDGQSGFIVTNPHASARTKDAVAKWINDEILKRDPDVTQAEPK